jgi:uncharacterized protein YbjQ (UPF0145 family)
MNKLKNILVTTTNNLEGLKIKQYMKPLSAHVVAGTNFFSDFFASFSDVFGGRSGTYQRQLSSIYTEAIEILKQSAVEIGANAVIGLKVDLDEISGKGKSMFMITATGTAVIIENIDTTPKTQTTERLSIISFEKMEEFRKRKEIIQLAKENKLLKNDGYGNLTFIDEMDNIWEFITSNSVYEVANEMLDISLNSKTYPKLLSYLFSLDAEFVANLLFNNLMSDTSKGKTKYLFDLMKDLRIFDQEKIVFYLQSDNETYKNRALQLVVYDKQTYLKEDVVIFEKIIQVIESSFKEIVTYSTKKGLLSKEKEVWLCNCGNTNDKELECCTNYECKKDKFGFSENEINPQKAIKKLEENIEIIKTNLIQ